MGRLGLMFSYEGLSRTDDVCIERAAQTAIRRNDEEKNPFFRPNIQKRMRHIFQPCREVAQNSLQLFRIRPRAKNALLRPPQLRRGNGFHRFCQLLCIFDRPDATPDIQKAWHSLCRAVRLVLESFFRLFDGLLQFAFDLVVDRFSVANFLEQPGMAGVQKPVEVLFKWTAIRNVKVIK